MGITSFFSFNLTRSINNDHYFELLKFMRTTGSYRTAQKGAFFMEQK
jgi:hypothetical protein